MVDVQSLDDNANDEIQEHLKEVSKSNLVGSTEIEHGGSLGGPTSTPAEAFG
jgi:hypothetical protein